MANRGANWVFVSSQGVSYVNVNRTSATIRESRMNRGVGRREKEREREENLVRRENRE